MDRIESDNPFLRGKLAPWPMEGEIRDCAVEGEIPAELAGTYYRNGANPQYPQLESYHIFDGDGMIHAFEIADGVCRYRNRWVRTERFEAERAAGERLFNGLMSGLPPDPRTAGLSGNTANTSIVWHGGRLLALWEGGPPYELEPHTLATQGIYDFDGALARPNGGGSMTAHPKIDPASGEMIFFGYNLTAPYLSLMASQMPPAVSRAGSTSTRRIPACCTISSSPRNTWYFRYFRTPSASTTLRRPVFRSRGSRNAAPGSG